MCLGKSLSITVYCLAMAVQSAGGQSVPSGFFMIVPVDKSCEHRVFTLRGDVSYCVAQQPIIPIHQFKSVKSIGSSDRWAVDVKLTAEGLATLNRIAEALPESTYLLVVEAKGIAVFDANGQVMTPITYDDLKWAEKHLATVIGN